MERRHILAGTAAILAAPFVRVHAQARHSRVGVLCADSQAMASPRVDALRRRMAELGHVEGRNVAFEVHYGAGQRPDGYRDAAAELVARKVDVIVADNTASTRATQRQSSTVPIVMVHTGDPVGAGFAKSLARPGGNVTGQSFVGRELNLKALDLVVEAVPLVRRVGVFYDPQVVVADPPDYRPLEDAVRAKRIDVVKVRLARGSDVDAALASAGPKLDAWLLVAIGLEEQVRLARIAVARRVPAISGVGDGAEAGALLSYGPNFLEFWRGAAVYVDRILKGASPADLPVGLPNSFELAVNQRTARSLGVVLPASLRARADRAIN